MKKDRLRVGVVGLKIGDGHVADYKASASVEEVVICDLDERQLNEVGDRHGVKKRYTDLAAMLATEKLDAVSICLPNKLHMPMTIQAIEAGCHVLCEKPAGAAELKRAKEYAIGSSRMSLERTSSQNMRMGSSVLVYGKIVDPETVHDQLRAVTAQEIQSVAREVLNPSAITLAMIGPDPDERMLAKVIGL